MQLKLGLLGYNSKLSYKGLDQFVRNNAEQVLRYDRGQGRLFLKDGTYIKALSVSIEMLDMQLRGLYLDQLILFDDNRWLIKWHRHDIISEVMNRMKVSIVPEEFQILHYEDVR